MSECVMAAAEPRQVIPSRSLIESCQVEVHETWLFQHQKLWIRGSSTTKVTEDLKLGANRCTLSKKNSNGSDLHETKFNKNPGLAISDPQKKTVVREVPFDAAVSSSSVLHISHSRREGAYARSSNDPNSSGPKGSCICQRSCERRRDRESPDVGGKFLRPTGWLFELLPSNSFHQTINSLTTQANANSVSIYLSAIYNAAKAISMADPPCFPPI